MRILADESVDRAIIDSLRSVGFDVVAIAELCPGAPDDDVLSRAVVERRLLVTADKDFGDLVFRQGHASQGVVLIRMSGVSRAMSVPLRPSVPEQQYRSTPTNEQRFSAPSRSTI